MDFQRIGESTKHATWSCADFILSNQIVFLGREMQQPSHAFFNVRFKFALNTQKSDTCLMFSYNAGIIETEQKPFMTLIFYPLLPPPPPGNFSTVGWLFL